MGRCRVHTVEVENADQMRKEKVPRRHQIAPLARRMLTGELRAKTPQRCRARPCLESEMMRLKEDEDGADMEWRSVFG